MLGNHRRPKILLPKQWPSRVRSGVLYAIYLAHLSPTYTRSWAANSFNGRLRLKQENDRLRQECLNDHWLTSLDDARTTIEAWRQEYNGSRPHSALGGLSPMEFQQAQGRMQSTDRVKSLTG